MAACGYGVDLDPGLGGPPATARYVPAPVPDPVSALTAMAERFGNGTGYEEAAFLLEQLAGADGVLGGLTAVARAASAWCEDLGHVPGDELADLLAETARDTEALAGKLKDTGPRVATLGRSWSGHEPSPRRSSAPRPPQTATVVTSGEPPPITFGTFPDRPTVVAIGASREDSLAARLLEKAGFHYLPELGIHELPADTHSLDAMLRVEDAADRLAAGFTNVGIDPAVTTLLDAHTRTCAASPPQAPTRQDARHEAARHRGTTTAQANPPSTVHPTAGMPGPATRSR
ncbi:MULTISPECIES: hypothetical protein [unclassified Kitasatospora]|uniref:hypothetical protein n=1 Tax=unclassified Kitasatospora TaxID=2633591 RepID=UPI0007106F1F|nr:MULTISPECIES: hypothetical protein [unclassified Kitasatospora]KQV20963.1 hypothetical protein ASC99_20910 [Kitasatospora sp. Root107]KRB60383.1 hypothetical protein ASE03_12265 [Kitasatospora sp. Root187]